MSKQYLTTHTHDDAHPSDIFSLAPTNDHLLSASGSSTILIHSTRASSFPLIQTLPAAHKLGCHHVCAATNGRRAASVGFGGEVAVWINDTYDAERHGNAAASSSEVQEQGQWREEGRLTDSVKAGELWAVCMSSDGKVLASTTYDGRINIWNLDAENMPKVREYTTRGAFGLCVAMSADGAMLVSGHSTGTVHVFDNSEEGGRLLHSLPGLVKPVRSVAISPGGTLVAAAGDAGVIALYEPRSGEMITVLKGHRSWIFSVGFSATGEWILSTGWDGIVKVWSVERRVCVATMGEEGSGKESDAGGRKGTAVWTGVWLPKVGRVEGFATAGASRGIRFYREAAGGG